MQSISGAILRTLARELCWRPWDILTPPGHSSMYAFDRTHPVRSSHVCSSPTEMPHVSTLVGQSRGRVDVQASKR